MLSRLLAFAALLACAVPALAQPDTARIRDVIYGRKHGVALTLDVFTPKKANGRAVVFAVSGGWFSAATAINAAFYQPFLKRGYTVFAVVHGSQPKFTIPEILEDMHRAIRFIRHNAKTYKIDPDKIAMTGASAGGHLTLMMATTGGPGDPKAKDPVDRAGSNVNVAGCFFPPTDFLNYGKAGNELIDRQFQPPFTAAMDYHEFDAKKALFVPVKDKAKLREITKSISPTHRVTKQTAPSLVIHGDKDTLVPIQQAEVFMARCKECEVPHKLEVRKGAAHGWITILADIDVIADWFDKHLGGETKKGE